MQKGEVLLTCRGCKQRFDVKDMKFDKSQNDMLCQTCVNKNFKPDYDQFKKTSSKVLESTGPRSYESAVVKYRCNKCGYSFNRAKGFNVVKCPFCSHNSVRKHADYTAQSFLDEC